MTQLIIDMIRFVIELVEKACTGDEKALKRLCEIAPSDMKTEIVNRVQNELDAKKFRKRK